MKKRCLYSIIVSLLVFFSFTAKAQVYVASQSSTYSTCAGTYANLTDDNFNTGPGTNSGTEWIKATFAVPQTVTAVSVAGGNINVTCSWGGVATYLNTAVIQSSTDDAVWTTRATVSGVTDGNGLNTFSVGCVTAQYWRIQKSGYLATTELSFTFGAPMAYSSGNTTQANTTSVSPGITNNEVIGIQIVTTGCSSPLDATSFSLNTTGTTNAANDISNAKLWYTGNSSAFATTSQFGSTVAAPNGSFSFTGTQTLAGGTNYFWLTYDVTAGATVNNYIDGECTSLTVGSAYAPTVTAPAGSRIIASCANTYTASQSTTYSTCTGTYANLTDGNFNTGPGTNSSATEWIKAAFACPKTVTAVSVAGGNINVTCSWGGVATYLNTAVIQSSTDDAIWTDRATISGVTDANGINTFSVGCVTAQYWRIKRTTANYLATTEFSFTFGSPMVFSSSTTTQNTTSVVGKGTANNEVIGIQIVTTGCSSPLSATSFSLNTTGTTAPSTDITNAKIWYTGTSSAFALTSQFGTTEAAPNGSFTITGTQTLSEGTNYFWLSYDVPAGATANNFIDGECTSLTVTTPRTPTVTAPSGNRKISPWTPPTFECVSSATNGAASVTVTKPGCVLANDLMIAHITSRSTITIGAPAGWIELYNIVNTQFASAAFYRVATGAEPADYTFTCDISDMNGSILIYRGVDVTDPIEASGAQLTASGTSHTTPCIAATTDLAMIVALFGLEQCSSCNLTDVNWTLSGMNERYDIGKVQSSYQSEAGYDIVQVAGGCAQKTATSYTSARGVPGILTLRPSGGTDAWSCTGCVATPLPVEWLNFTANLIEEKKIILHWATSSEMNNNYFTVERSTDGTRFSSIGTVQGAGNSSIIKNYSFIDNQQETLSLEPEIVLYYRIRQTDFDGNFKYSEIIAVTLKDKKRMEVNIHPNPANEMAYTDIFISEEKNLLLEIYNPLGEKIFTENYFLSAGVHSISIDFTWFTDGIYLIGFHTADINVYKKIAVQKNIPY